MVCHINKSNPLSHASFALTITKAMKRIGLIKKLKQTLSRHSLVTIYKSNVIPHVDYGYVMYDWQNIESFTQKTERTQYSATFAITITIKRISKSTLHSELGFESLVFKRCFRKLCTPFKIKTTGLSCPQVHRLSSASKGTSCANVHDLQQSYCGDNWEGTLFALLYCTFDLHRAS